MIAIDDTTSGDGADPAEEAWRLMQHFVESHNRNADLANVLGFRLGAGRGKMLYQLRNGPLTLSDLAEATGFDAPYTTTVVDKLEDHGLVERRLHPDDRRRKLVMLTPAGRAAISTADTIRHRPPRAVVALNTDELLELARLLRRVVYIDRAIGSN